MQEKAKTFIKNYGLMWHRDRVFWGTGGGGNKGSLLGRRKGAEVDFRRQIGVYVLYDDAHQPVYVGQAGQGNQRLFTRLRDHCRDYLSARWRYFSWFGLLAANKNGTLSSRDDKQERVRGTIQSTLNEIEGVLIAATEPAFNKQGAHFKGIYRYHQAVSEDADEVTTRQLLDKLNKIEHSVGKLRARLK
jgi:hypothetical protein